jgi:hypothetical protein
MSLVAHAGDATRLDDESVVVGQLGDGAIAFCLRVERQDDPSLSGPDANGRAGAADWHDSAR